MVWYLQRLTEYPIVLAWPIAASPVQLSDVMSLVIGAEFGVFSDGLACLQSTEACGIHDGSGSQAVTVP